MESTEQRASSKQTPKRATPASSAEEDRKALVTQTASTTTCQDSGLGSGQDAARTPKKVTGKARDEGKMLSPCMTSTPKKKPVDLGGESDCEIVSSRVILEDPLMSSIDEPGNGTDQQVESFTSDDESDDYASKLYATKVKARVDASPREPSMYKVVNDVSKARMSTSQSFSETIQQHIMEGNAACVKKNLFDIPVSPKLKNRVRERLYTLVNSIEGYEDRVYLRDEETSRQFHDIESISKVRKSPKNAKLDVNSLSKLPGYTSLDTSSNLPSSLHDLSNVSGLSASVMERYGCALSGIVTSQLKSLQHHQEQLSQEKMSLAVEKKEHETNARISLYHQKLHLMIQMVEELEVRSLKHQAAAREEAEEQERRMRQWEAQHRQEAAALKAEWRRKIEEAETQARSVQAAANQTCEQRISEVVSSTRVKSAALAREHEAQVSELKSAVTRLQAEKRVLEASLESSISEVDRTRLAAGSSLPQGGREAAEGLLRKQADPGRTGSSLYDNLLSIDLLKKKFQEEVEFWKGETERLQRKLHEADVVQRKLINDTFQDLHSTSKTEFEVAGTQTCGENEELRATIAVLRENLLLAGNENVTLKQKLNDCQKKEMELVKKLSLKEDEVSSLKALLKMSEIQVLQEKDNLEAQLKECAEHHEQTMVGYHLDVEREAGAAVSAALAHHQDKTRRLLADLGRRYEVLIARTREHSRTQINEYKKAVRCLKEKNKMIEKR